MASIQGFNQSQLIHRNLIQKQVSDSGQNAASTNVSQGHTSVSKQQSKAGQAGGLREESTLSEAARKAMEQEEVQKASEQGSAQNAQQAAGQKKAKEREKTRGGDGDIRGADHSQAFAPGEQEQLPDGSSIVHGDDEVPSFEINTAGTKRLANLDNPEYVRQNVLDTMPENTRAAAGKMIQEKTDTRPKREKHADLKMGDPKFSDQVEAVITKPTHKMDKRGVVGVVPIRSAKQEVPQLMEDPQSEEIMRRAAAEALAAGGDQEAFVA